MPGQSLGYEWLIQHFGLQVLPPHQISLLAGSGAKARYALDGREVREYRPVYAPEDTPLGHLLFALKHEGVNLEILKHVFQHLGPDKVIQFIDNQVTGSYARRIGFLYELLTGEILTPKGNIGGNYVDVLPKESYVTSDPVKNKKWRVNDNLLGDAAFCPMVRRTPIVELFIGKELSEAAHNIVQEYAPDVIQRASTYLYLKETKSSFEIERETPGTSRMERFMHLLRQAGKLLNIDRDTLIALHNNIVDPRFMSSDYRTTQNYVGESLGPNREKVHYISPSPEQVPDMMDGLLRHMRRVESGVPPVVQAATVAFGFVLIHPFEDGNGRLHRFLIHQILSRSGFTPNGLILPVSAHMLTHMRDYDECLESFSRQIMRAVDYHMDDDGRISVQNDLQDAYRYFDATRFAEYLFESVEQTIHFDFRSELQFLEGYKLAREAVQKVVDLPDKQMDLLFQLCRQNNGSLSKTKRKQFSMLSDREVAVVEEAVRTWLLPHAQNEQRDSRNQ